MSFSFASIRARLAVPVDASSIIAFRATFGAIVAVEIVRYLANDWIFEYWLSPEFHFTYFGFSWIRPLPGPLLYTVFVCIGLAAAGLIFGFFARTCASFVFLGLAYQFLLEEARYENYFYAAILFALLLAVVPQPASRGAPARGNERTQLTVPTWGIWLLRAQTGVIYAFAGIAKLSKDWLSGEPVRLLMVSGSPITTFVARHDLFRVVAYTGAAFDLLIVPALLAKRTRRAAFVTACAFHALNSLIFFDVEIFPWMMIAATSLFFTPTWPGALIAWARRASPSRTAHRATIEPVSRRLISAITLYLAVQLLLPLRHFAYGRDVSWTEEGHRLSWRMMLRTKVGQVQFYADTPEGRDVVTARDYVTDWQFDRMTTHPDMIVQLARWVRARYERRGVYGVQVHVDARVSLNGRVPQTIIDPQVDLATVRRTLWPPATWIVPEAQTLVLHLP